MQIGPLNIAGDLVLAPMAGVTDWAFRTVCAQLGAAVTVTEMVSSRALVYHDKKSLRLLRKTPAGLCGAQLFGSDPAVMADAAGLALEACGADFIDLNMGCPMPKIVGNGDGCALMRDEALAARVVEAVCKAVSVPVTVKMRTGWDKGSVNCLRLAQAVEAAGAAAVTVHGRTKSMLYSGTADWDTIRTVVEAVKIPVIANGDVFAPEDAVRILKTTGADAVMIGRGCFGNPWLFQQAKAALAGEPVPPLPPLAERCDTLVHQIERSAEFRSEKVALLEARRHYCWYLKGVKYANYYKEQINRMETLEDLYRVTAGIKRDLHD